MSDNLEAMRKAARDVFGNQPMIDAERQRAEYAAQFAEEDRLSAARSEGWQEAHDPRECGHPRACYLDKNWPESEKNYDPATKTGEPPMVYRCIMCESEERERRYREALERLQSGCFFLHPSEVKRIVDEALSPG